MGHLQSPHLDAITDALLPFTAQNLLSQQGVNSSVTVTTPEHLLACQAVTGHPRAGDNRRWPVDKLGGLWTTVRTIHDEPGIVRLVTVVGDGPCVDWHRKRRRRPPGLWGDVDEQSTPRPAEKARNSAIFRGCPHIPTAYYRDGFSLFKRKKNGDTVCHPKALPHNPARLAQLGNWGQPEARRSRDRLAADQ